MEDVLHNFVSFRQEFCRDLVREGRLDWDGFQLEADLADQASTEAWPPVGDRTPPAESRTPRTRRWGVRRRP
jgi:hypothetical protein